MRDNATGAAFKVVWDATPEIVKAVPGGLKEAPWPSNGATYNYATIAVSKNGAKANQYSSCAEIDFRRVVVTVYGLSQDSVAAACDLIDTAFVSTPTNRKTLTIAGAVGHMRTEAPPNTRGGNLERGDRVAEGQTWKGTLTFEIWATYLYGN